MSPQRRSAASSARSRQPAGGVVSDTRDPAEVAKFDAISGTWWDETGPMSVLHKFNPVRVAYVRDRAAERFGRDPLQHLPLAGLSIVDIGCGGGVLCEPLARLGAKVTGLDPAPGNVAAARAHAEAMGFSGESMPTYRETTIEAVVAEGQRFDVVLAMEVIEHVADVGAFVAASAQAVKPGGILIMATLNRTLKAYALAIIGAEYVLGWLPRGTHQWERFIRPEELSDRITAQGLEMTGEAGVIYRPLSDTWHLSQDTAVNYMLCAVRPDGDAVAKTARSKPRARS
jgi:2-polyprenyl-6-hydroxyphenyl methylase / 3-demethylubiquinone-9 3-methyltransferase